MNEPRDPVVQKAVEAAGVAAQQHASDVRVALELAQMAKLACERANMFYERAGMPDRFLVAMQPAPRPKLHVPSQGAEDQGAKRGKTES